MNAGLRGWVAVVLMSGFAGCADFGRNETTTSPTAEQVAVCRRLMMLQPDIEVEPIGYKFVSHMDPSLYFKFRAQAASIDQVFLAEAQTKAFKPGFALKGHANTAWWDPEAQPLVGGEIEVPDRRYLLIGYFGEGNGWFTVYAYWLDT